ncbi:MAG: lactonase family protein [Polyangiaceae bacterium]|nr:lactonase family protein [Polyangiaceae bacterium]
MVRLAAPLLALLVAAACGDDTGSGGSGGGGNSSSGGSTANEGGQGAQTSDGGSSNDGGGGEGGAAPQPTIPFVYVGTEDGTIERYRLDREDGSLEALGSLDVGGNPSFLAAAPDHLHLYAVNEAGDEVIALSIDPASGQLTELNRKSSEGNGPAYVSVDRSGAWVLVANYGGGTVAVLPIQADGSIGDAVDVESPGENAHLVRTDPSNEFVYVPCLGSDHVARYAFDAATGELDELAPPADLPNGTGPRHLDFHPSLDVAYVIGELGDSMTTFATDDTGALTETGSVSTLPNGADADANYCADVHVHPNGKFLYGSNRGEDSIAIFSLDASGATTAMGHISTGGEWPRNFGIDPKGGILLVANQHSAGVVSFRVDESTGDLTELGTTATGSGPSWVGVVEQPR